MNHHINTKIQSLKDFNILAKSGGKAEYITKESGGSQDNQYKEQKEFLKRFRERSTGSVAFFVLCDGPYYGKKQMAELEQLTRKSKPLSFACSTEDVSSKIRLMKQQY